MTEKKKRTGKRPTLDPNTGLAPRDIEIIEFMNVFGGKMFTKVLAKTIYSELSLPEQQARDRINKLKNKYKIFKFVSTGLMSPRNIIYFSAEGKKCCQFLGIEAREVKISPVMITHIIYEMITYYWLRRAGRNADRTIGAEWREKGYKHTPDIVYYKDDETKKGMVYVEIETNKKTVNRYLEIFAKMESDGAERIIYVFEDDKKMAQIGRVIPMWDRLYYTTIDMLIEGGKAGKIAALKQSEFIKTLDEKKRRNESYGV